MRRLANLCIKSQSLEFSAQISTYNTRKFLLIKFTLFMKKITQYLQDIGECIMKMYILYKQVIGRGNASSFMKMCFFLRYLLALMYQKYLSMHLSLSLCVCMCVCVCLSITYLSSVYHLYFISNLNLRTASVSPALCPLCYFEKL